MRDHLPRRRAGFVCLLLGLFLVLAPFDTFAQNRERGRTSSTTRTSERAETRSNERGKAEQATRNRGTTQRSTQRGTSRTRNSEASRNRSATQQRSRSAERNRSTGRTTERSTTRSTTRTTERGTTTRSTTRSTTRTTERDRNNSRGTSRTGNERSSSRQTGIAEQQRGTLQRDRGRNGQVDRNPRVNDNRRGDNGRNTRDGTRRSGVDRDDRRNNNGRVTRDGSRRNGVEQGNRSRYRNPNYRPESVRPRYTRRDAYRHKRFYGNRHYPTYRRSHVHIHVDLHWPWVRRYNRHWAPRYRYRQVVYVDAGWGRHRRTSRVEVRTTYSHQVTYANHEYAELDLYIEAVELYQNGRYLGYIDRIPNNLSRLEATVYRDGYVHFNRNIFVVGDAQSGFEMISTRHYDGHILDRYDRRHGYKVGRVDFRRGRVVERRNSRLFDPYDFAGFVPISLLPEDEGWLWDKGFESVSSHYDDYDYYYGSTYDPYVDEAYDAYGQRQSGAVYLKAPSEQAAPRGQTSGTNVGTASSSLSRSDEVSYRTQRGANIQLRREMQIERIN